MSRLDRYIERYGPIAGPKLYHAIQSRSAYMGVSSRRRKAISELTGRPIRVRRKAEPASVQPLLGGMAEEG
ncbi:hypothetical protein EP7_001547 [Isosphaeraceae bacterium EP7]